jgi:siderophore synthetase component
MNPSCSTTWASPADEGFRRHVPGVGDFSLRPLAIPDDMALLHGWVARDEARFWGMRDASAAEVEAAYRALAADGHTSCLLGLHHGRPAFLLECYDPAHDALGAHYPVVAGDRGMHVLVAPAATPIAGFTLAVMSVILDFLFQDPAVRRVVVEPDVRNDKIHVLNRRAGFVYQHEIVLPHKRAHLAFCTREQYLGRPSARLTRTPTMDHSHSPHEAVAHLTPEHWATANRLLLRKAIAEFSHERLLCPAPQGRHGDWTDYRLPAPRSDTVYTFRARRFELEHWGIDADSLRRRVAGEAAPLDALAFIVEFKSVLGIAESMLPLYLDEISSTLYGSAYKHARSGPGAAALTGADFQTVESAMMEGHPGFVANNGRIGFDADDYVAYAPEAASPVRLVWLAVHRSRATFACVSGLSDASLLREELGDAQLADFARALQARGLKRDDYLLMPAHPWQWFNKLAIVFAADIALCHIVCLGYGRDRYQAQQSIRTFFNLDRPQQRYVKTALSILNMGFMRGLSPYYMLATPAINEWIGRLVASDPCLVASGFTILREVASIGFRNRHYEQGIEADSPCKKMLSALWRESPLSLLGPGQRLMTMASLLHLDADGHALLPALIRSSGLDSTHWLRRYLQVYLVPLLHCFYAHALVFMPHGENLILLLDGNVPVRAIMKDIAEEAAILDPDADLPDAVRRLAVAVPDEMKILSLFTDVFDGFFRFMAPILDVHGDLPQAAFWREVAACVQGYQATQPQLAARFAQYDLFAAEFPHSCLNRLQLGNNQQMIDLAQPAKNLRFAGTLANPIARYAQS